MTTEAGALADSRAVLIGVSAYEGAEFPPIRAARNSVQAIRELLTDPALCGWPPERITVIPNPISAPDLADSIADAAENTTGVLLLYYVGHGALSNNGELYLTVTSTRPARPKVTGLAWETVDDMLRPRNCPARMRLVILDCCFAGHAIEALGGDSDLGLADITHIEGAYTLTATTRNRTAHVPPPGQQDTACTSFTSELCDLIRTGIPGRPERLTLGDIYPVLRQRLRAKGLPAPNQHNVDLADLFPFTKNAAAHRLRDEGNSARAVTQTVPTPIRIDRLRAIDLLGDAEHIARSITDDWSRALALADVAAALAATDPDRAARLTADAERVARSITSDWPGARALASIATALAATDPDRAERVAQSITDKAARASALATVATALAATDPDRAARLIADAEHVARSITSRWWMADKRSRVRALADVAKALAATDPDRAARLIADAERVAQSITDRAARASALADVAKPLADVAKALAATDPDRAELVARSITPESSADVATALVDVAAALAATDPDRAELVARSITSESSRARALATIATALAATDPDGPRGSSPTQSASPGRSPPIGRGHRHWPTSRRRWPPPTRTGPNSSPGPSPPSHRPTSRRRWSTSRRRWPPPTRTEPNSSPGPSPPSHRGHGRSRQSRRRWPPPTPIGPRGSSPTQSASPGRSPPIGRGHRHWPTSRRRWPPPTRTGPRGSSPTQSTSPGRSPTRSRRHRRW